MNILGISAYYHDAAAALVQDGLVVAAAQEERFSRKKHDPGFPRQAVAYCLEHAGATIDDLDAVVFYDKPLLKFERLLEMSHVCMLLWEEPRAGFAQRVVSALPAPLVWYRPLIKRWSTVAAAACVALLLALSFIYINSGTLETEAILGLEEIWVEDAYAFE